MALSGHSADLQLADLLQANLIGRNTCRISVMTHDGRGTIYLDKGAVLHATYGNLVGPEAFFTLVTSDDVYFQVDSGVMPASRTIAGDWQGLLLEAMRRKDEGLLRLPDRPSGPSADDDLPTTQPPRTTAGAQPARSAWRSLGIAAASTLVLAGVLVAGIFAAHSAPDTATASPRAGGESGAADAPIEVTDLSGPGDAVPRLILGEPPQSPDPGGSLRPSIVCRVLVDSTGIVKDVKIFHSRLDLAAYEDAAVDAATHYVFKPAVRRGKPVAVWTNVPVSFR